MAFSKEVRQWWLRAWGDGDASKASCQKTFYSEANGFYRNCHRNNLYVMVIEIEGRGVVGVPICREHFMVRRGTNIYGSDSSLYPELSWKLKEYSKNKNSFKEYEHSSETHRTRAGDWSTDEYLFNFAREKALIYNLKHPEDKKEPTKVIKRRNWVDIVYDGFYGEDQEKS